MKRVLAFDLGASSGRAILGSFDGERIVLSEVHRFGNDPVLVSGTFHWDVLRLFHEVKQGILNAKNSGGFDALGIDTWGVDFGLLDAQGRLLANPVHYRDTRTEGIPQQCFQTLSQKELYAETGIQFLSLNTLYQLVALRNTNPALMRQADCLLFMADLLVYFLTGQKVTEASLASTSQLLVVPPLDDGLSASRTPFFPTAGAGRFGAGNTFPGALRRIGLRCRNGNFGLRA
ncbi:MAG: FGGY family carbohydrate kinase [Angelakisella sp.]